jgi:hypothetical protein
MRRRLLNFLIVFRFAPILSRVCENASDYKYGALGNFTTFWRISDHIRVMYSARSTREHYYILQLVRDREHSVRLARSWQKCLYFVIAGNKSVCYRSLARFAFAAANFSLSSFLICANTWYVEQLMQFALEVACKFTTDCRKMHFVLNDFINSANLGWKCAIRSYYLREQLEKIAFFLEVCNSFRCINLTSLDVSF